MEFSKGDSLADWNMAKATMIRMDHIMRELYRAYMLNDGSCYYQNVISLYREVYPELKDDEVVLCNQQLDKCTLEYNKLMLPQRRARGVTMTPNLLKEVNEFELLLRRLMGKHDLLLPHKDDPRNLGRRSRY
jgi:hypothetical protein